MPNRWREGLAVCGCMFRVGGNYEIPGFHKIKWRFYLSSDYTEKTALWCLVGLGLGLFSESFAKVSRNHAHLYLE